MPPTSESSSGTLTSNTSPRLPLEVLSIIFDFLLDVDIPTLASCCRISKAIHPLVAPILYRRVWISPVRQRDSCSDVRPSGGAANGKHPRPVIGERKKGLLKNARVLCLDAHFRGFCDDNLQIDFPQLEILTICPLATDSKYNNPGPMLHVQQPYVPFNLECSILKGLLVHPLKKIVIDTTFLSDIRFFPKGFAKTLYDNVEQITFISPSADWKPADYSRESGFPDTPQLKKVVWIFFTPDNKTRWKNGTPRTNLDEVGLASTIWKLPEVPVYVVNSGAVYPGHFDCKVWEEQLIQSKFRKSMLGYLDCLAYKNHLDFTVIKPGHPDYNPSTAISLPGNKRSSMYDVKWNNSEAGKQRERDEKEKVKRKTALLHFITMPEYLKDHDWEGELDPSEVRVWLGLKNKVKQGRDKKGKGKE